MAKIWYQTWGYRWSSITLITLCGIIIAVLLLLDITTNHCNDQYHDITGCLESDTCEEAYCEPTPCANHTCLPRLKSKCIYGDTYYYPDDECPEKQMYRTSYVVLGVFGVIVVVIAVYVFTLCHYRYAYHPYVKLEESDSLLENDKNSHGITVTVGGSGIKAKRLSCMVCDGYGEDLVLGTRCLRCGGTGVF